MFFAFVKYGYEEEETLKFDDRDELEEWLINNADDNNISGQACVNCIVEGEEIKFEIVKKATEIKFL